MLQDMSTLAVYVIIFVILQRYISMQADREK